MSQLGLGLNLSKTKGGVVPFNPLSLDPYLLFDSETSMRGTLEGYTLDLDPATPSSLDVITASRTGVATYTDADGLIQTAAADTVRVDYTQGEQLTPTVYQRVGYTDFSNTSYPLGWQSSGTTLVEGAGYLGQPSRIFTAESQHQYVACGVPTTAGVTYTGSIWVRRISGNETLVVQHSSSATGTNSSSLSVTTEWTKVEVQFLGNASNGNIFFGIKVASSNAAGTSFEISQPQVEEGTTATDFVANTTGSPKFITGATFGPRVPMILVEPSATNLFTYSEDATQWTGSNRTVTPNTTTAPDGNQTAATIVRTAGSGDVRGTIQSVSAGLDYSLSIFAKADTDALIKLDVSNSVFGSGDVTFNARTGEQTAGDTTKASVEMFPNGWRRFVFTPTCAVTGTSSTIIRLENDEPVQLWGFQFEEGSVTSYIPTSGSTVTRASDDLVITGSDFTDFFNGSEGTFYIEAIDRDVSGGAHAYIVGQGTSQFFLYKNNAVAAVNNFDGVNGIDLSGIVSNQLFRAAVSYKTGVSPAPSVKSLSLDGTTLEDRTYNGNFASTNILKIGSGYTNVFSGHFRRILYWPTSSDRL